jgi:hypothetical protein
MLACLACLIRNIFPSTVHNFFVRNEKNTEPECLNFSGAQESIPRNRSASLCSLAGRYGNPISTRFLAPIDCLKIPALLSLYEYDAYLKCRRFFCKK